MKSDLVKGMRPCGTTEIQDAISNGKSPIQSWPKAQIALVFTSPEASAIMKIGTKQAWIHGREPQLSRKSEFPHRH